MAILIEKRKVLAYITWERQLLVFEHVDDPSAGIQVPAGTVEEGEMLEAAVLREAFEETGLNLLTLGGYLGYQKRDMRDFGKAEWHHRYFYHLIFDGEAPPRWRHDEKYRSDGLIRREVFELYWVDIDTVPPLIADQGLFLHKLRLKIAHT